MQGGGLSAIIFNRPDPVAAWGRTTHDDIQLHLSFGLLGLNLGSQAISQVLDAWLAGFQSMLDLRAFELSS